jgi:uncharacterized protein HemX
MIFLGLVLVAVAVATGVAVVMENSDPATLSAFGKAVPGIDSEWQVFLAGALVALLVVLGVSVAVSGMRRSLDLRRELRDLRDEHEEVLSTMEMEKRQLQRELAKARQNGGGAAPAVPAQRVAPPMG